MKTSYPYPSGQSNLADAKARLNIHALWNHFNFTGQPAASCRCPWREDHKPSFSVNADGSLWNDFSTGEAGDAVDFFQRATGLSQKDACRKFIELAGGHFTPLPRAGRQPSPSPSSLILEKARRKKFNTLPAFATLAGQELSLPANTACSGLLR